MAFSYVERILHAPDVALAVATGVSTLEGSLPMLDRAGFQRVVTEDFFDALIEVVRSIAVKGPNGKTLDNESLLGAFQDPMSTYVADISFALHPYMKRPI